MLLLTACQESTLTSHAHPPLPLPKTNQWINRIMFGLQVCLYCRKVGKKVENSRGCGCFFLKPLISLRLDSETVEFTPALSCLPQEKKASGCSLWRAGEEGRHKPCPFSACGVNLAQLHPVSAPIAPYSSTLMEEFNNPVCYPGVR